MLNRTILPVARSIGFANHKNFTAPTAFSILIPHQSSHQICSFISESPCYHKIFSSNSSACCITTSNSSVYFIGIVFSISCQDQITIKFSMFLFLLAALSIQYLTDSHP